MAAPKGNQFWKLRAKHGRDRIFQDPDSLWSACCEYFEEVSNNPLYVPELVKYKEHTEIVDVPKPRAMTMWGLYTFLGITEPTWIEYRKLKDFTKIVTGVEEIIKNQKLEGAMAGFFNANIVARDLGLRDKQEINTTVSVIRKQYRTNEDD